MQTTVICTTQHLPWKMRHTNSSRILTYIYLLISARLLDLEITKKKKKRKEKRTCKIVDFAVPAKNRVKLKVSEKKDKYQDLARELKKLWDMKVKIIPMYSQQRIDTRTWK